MGMAFVVGVVAVTVVATAVIVHKKRDVVERGYERFKFLRKFAGAVILVVVAWTFIQSGSGILLAIAILSIFLATVYVMIERPHEEVV